MAITRVKRFLKLTYLKTLPFLRQPMMYPRQYLKFLFSKRKVFVDCGANLGKVSEQYFQKKKNFEFFAFEPQPELKDTGLKLSLKYPQIPFKFYPMAVWTEDTELDLYLSEYSGKNYKDASTLLSGHTRHNFNVLYDTPVKVKAIDFSSWIFNTFQPQDYIIIKMDIEGAEYEVLEKMTDNGAIDYINELIVEFHQLMNETISIERHNSLLKKLRRKVKLIEWH